LIATLLIITAIRINAEILPINDKSILAYSLNRVTYLEKLLSIMAILDLSIWDNKLCCTTKEEIG